MIKLKPELLALVTRGDVEGLRQALQQAIMLEHSTIPVYLYALYSIKPGSLVAGRNLEVYTLLRSVVLEEMLHMSLACNLLNAVGGKPGIDKPAFIPTYPGPLPGGVESGLTVRLRRFSKELVHDEFMEIEEPEDPLQFPVEAALAGSQPEGLTIGQFYAAISKQIVALGPDIFIHDTSRQVTSGFFPDLTEVTDPDSALNAIELIVEQGEGTATSPLDEEKELAHYYRFAEIWYGKRLVPVPNPPPDFAYAGDPIPFDPNGVWPVVDDPSSTRYTTGSAAWYANETFNYTYTSLLKSLHATFNGQRDQLDAAIGIMESLKQQAIAMVSIDVGDGLTAGPSFEYQPVLPKG